MKFFNRIFIIFLFFLSGCASFKSGDIFVSRNDLSKMIDDKNKPAFKTITANWKNYPYQSATKIIGMGSITNPPKRRAFKIGGKNLKYFKKKAEKIFKETGLYDPANGKGELKLTLTSFNRWTYKNIFSSFLVETGWIMILPASLRVNYYLAAEFDYKNSPKKIEETARVKTIFHPLMIPIYPLSNPGSKEKSVIKSMLWKLSSDIYMENFSSSETKNCLKLEKLRGAIRGFSGTLDRLTLFSDLKGAIRKRLKSIDHELMLTARQCSDEKKPGEFLKKKEKIIIPDFKRIDFTMSHLIDYGYPPDECWKTVKEYISVSTFGDWIKFLPAYSCCVGNGRIQGCLNP